MERVFTIMEAIEEDINFHQEELNFYKGCRV